MKKLWWRLWFILALTAVAIAVNLIPQYPLKTGLDLQGGTHLLLQADMGNIDPNDRTTALESVKQVITRRVDLYGVSEPMIQTSNFQDDYRLIVELSGVKDVSEAISLIGQTAQLDFREDLEATPGAETFRFLPTGLTGKDLKKATVTFSQGGNNTGQPEVSLEFTTEGAKKFGEITQRNVGRQLAIFLDNQPVTTPVVSEAILSGTAQISGNFTTKAATDLSIQLNAGALPVPIKIIEQKNISATLGSDSVRKSVIAGSIGLGLVALFMILLYGVNGFLADVALVIYGLITLAIYKLIPVTLTLPGIAGFILTIGMAVDSNILIFERLKEELRAGRPFSIALELAFGRAWDSIKDANVATIITSLVLINPLNFNFLNTSGLVRGFALTLLIGVIISLFTGIIVTRTLMRLFLVKKV
ncbi:MAG: Preprotein translocase subunit SecD [Candidatus Beckwithbacteria bacterium GW2011_GWA2_43_10]|uniref:Protein translocase subunit SecD n=1 Tax=Candidatus Beckwithbacteria bacterium GW2011_GWA2_43_10 TaxID=1618369 RepID=A0A0G1C440_9BACT|nr:MAG: Preprotein translocase subunit SecD [Candidatus Beckwithbacteria bacterium GW2011_GWA2_43_10]